MMSLPLGHLILRLILSSILGGLVGYERERHSRPAGLRTHILVCLGSTLIMLVSSYGFLDDQFANFAPDPARVAAQVVSGIGFLGAGTILRQGATIKGLTTAASLWVVAGVGLAVGIGYYEGAVITTVMVLVSLYALTGVERVMVKKRRLVSMAIIAIDQPGLLGKVGCVFGEMGINVNKISLSEAEYQEAYKAEIISLDLLLQIPSGVKVDTLLEYLMAQKGILEVTWDGGTYSSQKGRSIL